MYCSIKEGALKPKPQEYLNLKKLLKEAGYIDRTVDEYLEESDKYFDQIAKGEVKPYQDKFHQSGWLNKETGKFDMHWT